jgi:hypothetical protein
MQAKQELTRLKEKLQKHIAVLNAEMDTVDKAIRLLERESESGAMTGPQDRKFRNMGLSETCRLIVGGEWISPTEVRDQMTHGGFKNDDKSKLLAAVYATLKRLGNNELEGKKVDGKMKYRKRQPVAMSSAAEAA